MYNQNIIEFVCHWWKVNFDQISWESLANIINMNKFCRYTSMYFYVQLSWVIEVKMVFIAILTVTFARHYHIYSSYRFANKIIHRYYWLCWRWMAIVCEFWNFIRRHCMRNYLISWYRHSWKVHYKINTCV